MRKSVLLCLWYHLPTTQKAVVSRFYPLLLEPKLLDKGVVTTLVVLFEVA